MRGVEAANVPEKEEGEGGGAEEQLCRSLGGGPSLQEAQTRIH